MFLGLWLHWNDCLLIDVKIKVEPVDTETNVESRDGDIMVKGEPIDASDDNKRVTFNEGMIYYRIYEGFPDMLWKLDEIQLP